MECGERGSLFKKDDVILIQSPAKKIAADGLVTEGESAVNESMLTGESRPVENTAAIR